VGARTILASDDGKRCAARRHGDDERRRRIGKLAELSQRREILPSLFLLRRPIGGKRRRRSSSSKTSSSSTESVTDYPPFSFLLYHSLVSIPLLLLSFRPSYPFMYYDTCFVCAPMYLSSSPRSSLLSLVCTTTSELYITCDVGP